MTRRHLLLSMRARARGVCVCVCVCGVGERERVSWHTVVGIVVVDAGGVGEGFGVSVGQRAWAWWAWWAW